MFSCRSTETRSDEEPVVQLPRNKVVFIETFVPVLDDLFRRKGFIVTRLLSTECRRNPGTHALELACTGSQEPIVKISEIL